MMSLKIWKGLNPTNVISMFYRLPVYSPGSTEFVARLVGVAPWNLNPHLPFSDDKRSGVDTWGLDLELENGQRIFAETLHKSCLEELEGFAGKKIKFELLTHFSDWVELDSKPEKHVVRSEMNFYGYFISGLIMAGEKGFELDCGLSFTLRVALRPGHVQFKDGMYARFGDPRWWDPSACWFEVRGFKIV